MTTEQFYSIIYSAQVGNALFLIAGALVIIAYIMTVKFTSKQKPSRK